MTSLLVELGLDRPYKMLGFCGTSVTGDKLLLFLCPFKIVESTVSDLALLF